LAWTALEEQGGEGALLSMERRIARLEAWVCTTDERLEQLRQDAIGEGAAMDETEWLAAVPAAAAPSQPPRPPLMMAAARGTVPTSLARGRSVSSALDRIAQWLLPESHAMPPPPPRQHGQPTTTTELTKTRSLDRLSLTINTCAAGPAPGGEGTGSGGIGAPPPGSPGSPSSSRSIDGNCSDDRAGDGSSSPGRAIRRSRSFGGLGTALRRTMGRRRSREPSPIPGSGAGQQQKRAVAAAGGRSSSPGAGGAGGSVQGALDGMPLPQHGNRSLGTALMGALRKKKATARQNRQLSDLEREEAELSVWDTSIEGDDDI
jgi:hypothetical protein